MRAKTFGKWILIFGLMLVVVWRVETLGLSLDRLPGDIYAGGKGWFFSFPIMTSIVVSVVLTILLNVAIWLFRR